MWNPSKPDEHNGGRKDIEETLDAVIELLNNRLMARHHAGELDAAELVRIASIVLCEAAAIVLFQNEALSRSDLVVDATVEAFCKMFAKKAKIYAELERLELGQIGNKTQGSAWDGE